MSQGERRCRTCRFFQAAPLVGKGWCRNPVLYAPSQQHLVESRDLDCQRAFGDFWQAPLDLPDATLDTLAPPPGLAMISVEPGHAPEADLTPDGAPAPIMVDASRRGRGRPALLVALVAMLAVLGGLVALTSAPPRPTIMELGPAETPAILAAAPVEPTAPPLTPAPASPTVVATAKAEPTPAATRPVLAEPTATVTTAAETAPDAAEAAPPTPAPAAPVAPAPAARAPQPTPRPAPVGKLKVGGQGVVATGAADQRLRVRSAPDLQAGIIGRLPNGSKIAIIDGPRQADGTVWWRVRADGSTGWVSGSFVTPAVP